MKRKLAWIGAILSGLYLLTAGPIPDPIPLIDEGVALVVFLKCTAYLGYDMRKWLTFFGKNHRAKPSKRSAHGRNVTIDV